MKSLVSIAKEMGFPPNPDMTKDDWSYLIESIQTYFLHTDTGLDADNDAESRRRDQFTNIPYLIYHTNCLQKRGGFPDVVAKNISALKSRDNSDILVLPQTFPGNLETTSYIWRNAKNSGGREEIERFTADINMGSRFLPAMLKKLDQFAVKYHSRYKMPNLRTRHRVDTLNVYMTQDITPEMATELYGILKPCLKSTHHDRLNGLDIYLDNKPVKGIKIGPLINGNRASYDARVDKKNRHLANDIANPDLREIADSYLNNWLGDEPYIDRETDQEITAHRPSLGEMTTSVELMNLMYYMLGKEGQNPFQLTGYDNKPYQKHISITDTTKENAMSDSFFKKITSLFKKSDEQPASAPAARFDWEDPKLWSDVQVDHGDEIRYGHRINIQHLTPDQRAQIKAGLDKRHIVYTERNATARTADIYPGDLTIRVSDPASVKQLRAMVFQWAEGPHTRPLTKSKAAYEAEQKSIRDKRSPAMGTGINAKWVDKKYWEKSSVVIDGKLEPRYVMDLGDPNDQLHDNPQPFGSGIEIVKSLAEKGITATVGRGITNGLHSYQLTHDSVIISGAQNVERFEKAVLHQSDRAPMTPDRGNSY